MGRYFSITEIDADTFEHMTGDSLDCSQVVSPLIDVCVYVAVDDDEEDGIDVNLEMFGAGGDT